MARKSKQSQGNYVNGMWTESKLLALGKQPRQSFVGFIDGKRVSKKEFFARVDTVYVNGKKVI